MNDNMESVEESIDFGAFFALIKRHIWLIVIMSILTFVAATVYAYFKPDIYEAQTSMQMQQKKRNLGGGVDFISQALQGDGGNMDNEQFLFTSHFLASKALETLDIGTRYFTVKNFKEIELYKAAPFFVNTFSIDEKAIGLKMRLIPTQGDMYTLRIDPPSQYSLKNLLKKYGILPADEDAKIVYEGEHRFGDVVTTPWFKIQVEQLREFSGEYSFSVVPNEYMWPYIAGKISTRVPAEAGSVLLISFEDNNPLRAAEIVNAVTRAYQEQNIEQKTAEAERTLKFIDLQLEAINKALKKSQSNLEKFKKGNIVVDITQKVSITTDKLSEYQSQVQELEIRQNVLSNLQEYMKKNKDISGIALGANNFVDANLAAMVAEVKNLAVRRKSLLTEFTELHPDVIKISESIESMRQSILFTIKNNLSVINQQKSSVLKIIQGYEKSLEALPEQEQKLANLTRSAMVNEKVYSYLLEKRAETAILRSSTVSKTRIIDSAEVPAYPIKPNRTVLSIVGLLAGMFLGVLIALVKERIANTITSRDDVENSTTTPIYGVIPFVKNKKSTSAVLEAYRALRTNLEFMRTDIAYQTLVVTSMVSGEGKTTVSTNLARILASTGKKVLLVDLDMRRANLSKFFDLDNEMGISTLLSRKHTIFQVVKQDVQEGVDVMPAGPVPPNPSELIMSEYAKEILTKLRSSYDFIVLDSPPVGLVTDSSILMHRVDASLFVMRQNYTKREFVKHFNKIVADHKIDHIGIVLNGVDLKSNYGYGNKYGGNKYY